MSHVAVWLEGATAVLALGFLVVASGLVRIGWRGRRLDDHPLCRRCGFDLTGKPPESTRCSECGADLAAANAVRIGHYRRRLAPLIGGLVLGFLGLLGGTVVGVAFFGAVDWQSHKPLFWLLHDAVDLDAATRTAALKTIAARYDNHELSPAQVQRLIARALDVQGDRVMPWEPQWADWIEREQGGGRLAAADWSRYARQGLGGCKLEPRARVCRG